MKNPKRLTLHCSGPLKLIGPEGADLTPRGRKAQGVLALLAMAPSHRRPRATLQDKLWSDRQRPQGAASLRQALTEIRKAMGPHASALWTDRTMVSLDPSLVLVATAPLDLACDDFELFEGLDVVDPEFEDWLRDQRQAVRAPKKTLPRLDFSNIVPQTSPSDGKPEGRRTFQLVVKAQPATASHEEALLGESLADVLARTIAEQSAIEIVEEHPLALEDDKAPTARVGYSIRSSVSGDAAGSSWRLAVTDTARGRVVGSAGSRIIGGLQLPVDSPEVLREINRLAHLALSSVDPRDQVADERLQAMDLCRQAVSEVFKLSRESLMRADRLFESALAIWPRGIYFAWRAFLRMYLVAERLCDCRQTTIEEAQALIREALARDPMNSYVASFAAHVHTIAKRSYVAAYEMAQRSLELNPCNPMGWACLGMAECHLGKSVIGYEHARFAREIAGSTPLRFHVDAIACITGSINNDLEAAIWYGEASRALSPDFKPPLRYLTVLYLLANQRDRSLEVMQQLQSLEPDFSYDILREKSYPAASLHHARLLDRLPSRQI